MPLNSVFLFFLKKGFWINLGLVYALQGFKILARMNCMANREEKSSFSYTLSRHYLLCLCRSCWLWVDSLLSSHVWNAKVVYIFFVWIKEFSKKVSSYLFVQLSKIYFKTGQDYHCSLYSNGLTKLRLRLLKMTMACCIPTAWTIFMIPLLAKITQTSHG